MDAIVTAGGIPQSGDPLYAYSNGDSKALIDVGGKPMVQWVLDALSESKTVDKVIVIGLTAKSGLTCKKPLYYLSNQGRMLANIVAGVNKSIELNKKSEYVLLVSSDIPALKGEMVDWLVKIAMKTRDDLYYGVCPREVMEARYPTSHRTYTKLKDMEVCGADINVIHVSMATDHLDTWEQLIGNRKSPLRQAAVIGWDTLYQFVTRQFTLQGLVERASERIGIKGRALIWSQAEPCMDVDKPHQLEIMREDFSRQQRKAVSAEKKFPILRKNIKSKPVKKSVSPAIKIKAKAKARAKQK
jgi:molybdopterin-guanine dinucleotide biosynthesis protein A